ncbi:MAG: hypothetical protein GX303_07190 [Clostridiales bacterium]|nr:hypothetical protein [Clostridiales bacterium]
MKMRILTSGKGKISKLGQMLADKHNCNIDVIPPAFNCEKERLVLIGASLSDELDNALVLFAKGMSKQRAQNVGLFLTGSQKGGDKLVALLKEAGTNVIEDIYWVNSGSLLSIFKGISAEEKDAINAWSDKVIESLA